MIANELFYSILIFIGLRKNKNEVHIKNNKKCNLISREIYSKTESKDTIQTPRNLTRAIYRQKYHKDLSPPTSPKNVITNVQMENAKNKPSFTWLYTLSIFFILCIKPSFCIYYILHPENNLTFYLSNFFFLLIEPIQYILSVIYFNTPHFEDFYLNKENLDPKCFPTTNQFSTFILSLLVIVGIFNFLFFSDISNKNIPETLTGNDYIDFTIELLSWIYGRLTIYINLLCFSLVFCKHCKIIKKYVKKIENENLTNANILSINIITEEILLIRNSLEDSISHFKNIFSSFTLLGTIGLGFFFERVKERNFNLFPWNQLIIYIIVQICFIIIIFRVSKYRNKIIEYTRSPNFVKKFLRRYTIRDVSEKFQDSSDMSINLQEENSSTLDWLILDRLLNEKWAEFKVLGIDISDGELIKRGIATVTILTAIYTYFQ